MVKFVLVETLMVKFVLACLSFVRLLVLFVHMCIYVCDMWVKEIISLCLYCMFLFDLVPSLRI